MKSVYVFAAVFFGILLLVAVLYPIVQGLLAISKWIERKTGNAALAYNAPVMVFVALIMATGAVWIVHVSQAAH